jgi:hypothetical protein
VTIRWLSADLRTGGDVTDLPTFVPEFPIRRTLGGYDTATGALMLDGAPPHWPTLIREGGRLLACYDDQDSAKQIQWAGFVVEQTRNTGQPGVAVSLATIEAYFDRRFVGDLSYSQAGQNLIASDLVLLFASDFPGDPGIPLYVDNIDGTDGTPRDRAYKDKDNATLLTRLSQLAGVIGGIEWTVEWEWTPNGEALQARFRVGSRIGISAAAGMVPAASFQMPGYVLEAQQVRSYADGNGANEVTAYSSGQAAADSVPTSGPIRAADFAGRPLFQKRYQPGSSITDTATLTDYARKAIAVLAPGSTPVTLTAQLADETRHGNLWRVGDDVTYQIGGTVDQADGTTREIVPQFPGGLAGIGRAIAYEVNAATISPILATSEVPADQDQGAA